MGVATYDNIRLQEIKSQLPSEEAIQKRLEQAEEEYMLNVFSSCNLRPFNFRTSVNRIDVGSFDGRFLWFMSMKLCFLLGMDYR